jgi:hypothetical protein
MDTVVALLLVCFLIWLLSLAQKNSSSIEGKSAQRSSQAVRFLPPIPKGFQIYVANPSVAGISYRKQAALNFANSSNQRLRLEREPDNAHDPNAIKIIGVSQAGEFLIGYVPREIAEQIADLDLFDCIQPRLARIYIGRSDFLDIQYQLIGPKSKKPVFDAFQK